MPQTIISIQQQYIDTVNAGHARWSHRPNGGHIRRIQRGAWRRADTALRKLGFTEQSDISGIIAQARDVAELERNADE